MEDFFWDIAHDSRVEISDLVSVTDLPRGWYGWLENIIDRRNGGFSLVGSNVWVVHVLRKFQRRFDERRLGALELCW